MPRIWWLPAFGAAAWLSFWITIFLFPITSTTVFVSIISIAVTIGQFVIPTVFALMVIFPVLFAISTIRDYWKEKQQRCKLFRVLADDAPYEAAFRAGGKEMMISLAFCELFVAHCLDVHDVEHPGMSKHQYRIKDHVDISLLSEIEQIVARNLNTFKSLPELHASALTQLRNRSSCVRPGVLSLFREDSRRDEPEEVADRYQKILSEALAFNHEPPMCGV